MPLLCIKHNSRASPCHPQAMGVSLMRLFCLQELRILMYLSVPDPYTEEVISDVRVE